MIETQNHIASITPSWISSYKNIYHNIVPFNIALAVFILIQNTIIIADYYKDRTRIIAFMFMSIAAADMVSAAAELARAAVGLSCIHNPDLFIPEWVVVCYLCVGLCGYACSIFYNTVLAITKTINMANPFYRLNTAAIKISLLVGSLLYLVVAIAGIIFFVMTEGGLHIHSCYKQWNFLVGYWYFGLPVVEYFFKSVVKLNFSAASVVSEWTGVFVTIFPCLIVLVCMVTQIVFIRKNLSGSSVNHINITVFLVSMLYFVCNAASGMLGLVMHWQWIKVWPAEHITMVYTLPMINAAFFPLIIITRKPDLRQKYKRFLAALLCFPFRICRSLGGVETLGGEDGVETLAVEDGFGTLAGEDVVETLAVEDGVETLAGEDGVKTAAVEDGVETAARGGWTGDTGRRDE